MFFFLCVLSLKKKKDWEVDRKIARAGKKIPVQQSETVKCKGKQHSICQSFLMVSPAYRRLERFMLIILFMNHKENVTACHLRERRLIKHSKTISNKIVMEIHSKGRLALYGKCFI